MKIVTIQNGRRVKGAPLQQQGLITRLDLELEGGMWPAITRAGLCSTAMPADRSVRQPRERTKRLEASSTKTCGFIATRGRVFGAELFSAELKPQAGRRSMNHAG